MKLINKRARFDYVLLDKTEAGIALIGSDIKLLGEGKVSLHNAYAKIINGQVFLIATGLDTRKLLLHKSEILNFEAKIKAKRLTLVPTKLYTKGHLVKVELALARPKKQFEKKESIKKKDITRELARESRVKD